jgi:hypothetical protein
MDLNKEAEEYANKNVTKSLHAAYVEGATNSKYVQAEKIKAQIEVLKELSEAENKLNASLIIILEDLHKQLNELENEKDNG